MTTQATTAGDAVACGPLWVSPHEMCEARVGDRRVVLSSARLRMLAALLRARGRVVSRAELYAAGPGGSMPQRSRAIDVHIARIRKALGAAGASIVTVPGVGYRVDVLELER